MNRATINRNNVLKFCIHIFSLQLIRVTKAIVVLLTEGGCGGRGVGFGLSGNVTFQLKTGNCVCG